MTGETGLSGVSLQPFTQKIGEFRVPLSEFGGSEICLVDTPGFDSDVDGIGTFKEISKWWINVYVLKYSGAIVTTNDHALFQEERGP